MSMKEAIKSRAAGIDSTATNPDTSVTDTTATPDQAAGGGDENQKQLVMLLKQIAAEIQDIFVTKKDVQGSVSRLSELLNSLIQLAQQVSGTEQQTPTEEPTAETGGVRPEGMPRGGKMMNRGSSM
jgi:hypothetical protein